MPQFFTTFIILMLMCGSVLCDEKKYIPVDGTVICPIDQEFDWPYDCNQCPDGYFVRGLDQKMVDQKGTDIKLGVTIAECSQPILDRPFKTISELNQEGDGEYNTEGYVVWKNEPWVCPENADCAAWIPEIVIAESFKEYPNELNWQEMAHDGGIMLTSIFFHDHEGHEKLKVGARYRFSLQKYHTEKSGGFYRGLGFELIH